MSSVKGPLPEIASPVTRAQSTQVLHGEIMSLLRTFPAFFVQIIIAIAVFGLAVCWFTCLKRTFLKLVSIQCLTKPWPPWLGLLKLSNLKQYRVTILDGKNLLLT